MNRTDALMRVWVEQKEKIYGWGGEEIGNLTLELF